jgi:hypothetical protein
MTRSASFFILSLVLHATALVYPVLFRGRGPIEKIQVTMLPIEEAGGAEGPSGSHLPGSVRKWNRIRPSAIGSKVESKVSNDPVSHARQFEALTNLRDSSTTSVSAIEKSPAGDGIIMSDSAGNDSQNSSAGGVGTGHGGSGSERIRIIR